MKPVLLGWMILLSVVFWLALIAAALADGLDQGRVVTETERWVIVHRDYGGSVGAYEAEIRRIDTAGKCVALKGVVASAATRFLGADCACAYPTATLGFHAAQGVDPFVAQIIGHTAAFAYPPALADWYLSAAVSSSDMVTLTGQQAINMGVRACR